MSGVPDFMTNPNNPGHPGENDKDNKFLFVLLGIFLICVILAMVVS